MTNKPHPFPPPLPAGRPLRPTPAATPRWTSEQLLKGQRQAELEHAGQLYRLSLTSQGKLILTK